MALFIPTSLATKESCVVLNVAALGGKSLQPVLVKKVRKFPQGIKGPLPIGNMQVRILRGQASGASPNQRSSIRLKTHGRYFAWVGASQQIRPSSQFRRRIKNGTFGLRDRCLVTAKTRPRRNT